VRSGPVDGGRGVGGRRRLMAFIYDPEVPTNGATDVGEIVCLGSLRGAGTWHSPTHFA
jgi:hypothetical protein